MNRSSTIQLFFIETACGLALGLRLSQKQIIL